jgi:hypothetical protein
MTDKNQHGKKRFESLDIPIIKSLFFLLKSKANHPIIPQNFVNSGLSLPPI